MLFLNTLLVGLAAHLASAHPKNTDAKLGAVASESAVCSKIGTDILKIGGNAADAVSHVTSGLWDFELIKANIPRS